MNLLNQIGIVFLLATVADVISRLLPLPIPTSIVGIILVLVLLLSNILKLAHIEKIADFFLKNMSFFFLAAGVSIMEKYHLISSIGLEFSFIVVVTTLLTFAATVCAVKFTIELQNKLRK